MGEPKCVSILGVPRVLEAALPERHDRFDLSRHPISPHGGRKSGAGSTLGPDFFIRTREGPAQ